MMTNGQAGLRLSDPDSLTRSERLNTVYAKASHVGEFDRNELFGGFTEFRALTYTSSIPMIVSLVNEFGFEKFECVFGHGGILSRDANAILSFQSVVDEKLNRGFVGVGGIADERLKALYERNVNGSVQFFVVKDAIAHAKIYLLESQTRKRVIVGSANLSETAFSGRQAETLVVFDDDDVAWSHFKAQYEAVKDMSSSELPLRQKPLVADIAPIQETPALQDIKKPGDQVEIYVPPETNGESDYGAHEVLTQVGRVVSIRKPSMTGIKPDKSGRVKINHEARREMIRVSTSNKRLGQTPLWLSFDGERFVFSDGEIALNPDIEGVREDVAAWIEFFDNYNNGFVGDVPRLQQDYFTFMCWFYFAPLMCDIRNIAIRRNRYSFDTPMFAVLFGESNCGKSVLLQTLMESMFGSFKFVETQYFTKTNLRGLQNEFKRFPVVFDDVGRDRFNRHAGEIVKDENIPAAEYPCFALSMNADTRNFQPEIVKRCLMVYTRTSLPGNETVARRDLKKSVTDISDRMSTSLYREYLRRILERLNTMDDDAKQGLDVLELSSSVLRGLIDEFRPADSRMPVWCKSITLDDYQNRAWERPKRVMRNMLHRDNYTSDRRPSEGRWTLSGDLVIYGVPVMGSRQIRDDIPAWILEETATVPGQLAMKLEAVEGFEIPVWRPRKPWQFWRRIAI